MSDESLRLTVLGSATPYPSADNPCSGYLVSSGDSRIWVDAGNGTLGPLQQHVRLDELDAIWISHLHADHSADLLTAYYGALYADIRLTAPIPLYGPPGIADRLAGFLTNTSTRSPIESAFAVTELAEGATYCCARPRAHTHPTTGSRCTTPPKTPATLQPPPERAV